MTPVIYTWACKYGVPPAALAELASLLNPPTVMTPDQGKSESAVQAAVRLEASQKGVRLWRNNVGALVDSRGVPVRYGLANDNKQINSVLKSADLIGIRPMRIESKHVGHVIGQFVSREVKEPGWTYRGTEHEKAQMAWAMLINSLGGNACFATGVGTIFIDENDNSRL